MRSSFFKFLRSIRRRRERTSGGTRRRTAVASLTTGRNTRTVNHQRGYTPLAPRETILRALRRGGRFHITDEDLAGWSRLELESLILILLVDVSQSTWALVKVFREILKSLAGHFKKHKDRVGLVSLQGPQAKIFTHPTHNFRVVARGLSRLKVEGETPLADGLQKALSLSILERRKNPGSRSVVILLSDCYPEPLTTNTKNVFDDPAYRSSVRAAIPYRRAGVTLLVINPAFESEEGTLPGERLSRTLAQVSGGRLIKLHRHRDRRYLPPSNREIETILKGVEDTFSGRAEA